jgi:hypothetical protein
MIQLCFKNWLEFQIIGGGLEPPSTSKQGFCNEPGQLNAMPNYNLGDLPPVKVKKRKFKK